MPSRRRVRRVLEATLCIAAIAAIGWIAFMGNKPPQKPPPREQLRQVGLVLPDSATHIECCVTGLFVGWIFARFDIPEADLLKMLTSPPLDRLPPFRDIVELNDPQLFVPSASDTLWWSPPTRHADAAKTAWYRPDSTDTEWMCSLTVAIQRREGTATVWLQHWEESYPAGKAAENNDLLLENSGPFFLRLAPAGAPVHKAP